MGQSYIQEMAERRRKKIEDKLRTINEDNANLQQIEKAANQEQFRNRMSKLSLKNDQDGVLKLRKEQREKEDLLKAKEREEYNNMVKNNINQEKK